MYLYLFHKQLTQENRQFKDNEKDDSGAKWNRKYLSVLVFLKPYLC